MNGLDPDPQPRYDVIDSNRHGTRCAGEVAATANNSLCAVGVAFGARVGGKMRIDKVPTLEYTVDLRIDTSQSRDIESRAIEVFFCYSFN